MISLRVCSSRGEAVPWKLGRSAVRTDFRFLLGPGVGVGSSRAVVVSSWVGALGVLVAFARGSALVGRPCGCRVSAVVCRADGAVAIGIATEEGLAASSIDTGAGTVGDGLRRDGSVLTITGKAVDCGVDRARPCRWGRSVPDPQLTISAISRPSRRMARGGGVLTNGSCLGIYQ